MPANSLAPHRGRIGPPQQRRDRQQHMRDQARHAPAPPGPQHPDPTNPAWPGPLPRRQHTRAIRAPHAAGRQPGLDQNLIHLYRDQRVPPCIRARPSRSYVYPEIPREGWESPDSVET